MTMSIEMDLLKPNAGRLETSVKRSEAEVQAEAEEEREMIVLSDAFERGMRSFLDSLEAFIASGGNALVYREALDKGGRAFDFGKEKIREMRASLDAKQ